MFLGDKTLKIRSRAKPRPKFCSSYQTGLETLTSQRPRPPRSGLEAPRDFRGPGGNNTSPPYLPRSKPIIEERTHGCVVSSTISGRLRPVLRQPGHRPRPPLPRRRDREKLSRHRDRAETFRLEAEIATEHGCGWPRGFPGAVRIATSRCRRRVQKAANARSAIRAERRDTLQLPVCLRSGTPLPSD